MSFFAPYLLPLLALASVPIIIHLLNRRRFQLVEWAPMKYLKLTLKTNRRRLRIEQLILLAIRTLIVALLIFAVARPVLSPTGLGGWLAGTGRTSRIVVIDDSLSMGYRDQGRSAFDSAKEVVTQIVRNVGPQDALTILRTSDLATPVVREVHVADGANIASMIAQLSITEGPSDWSAVFRAIDDELASATFPQKEIVLLTDLRKSGWDGQVSELAREWAAAQVEIKVIDVGTRETTNTSITRFEAEDALALPNMPVSLMGRIYNGSGAPQVNAQATLAIDTQTRPVILPSLPPGETTEIPLTITPTAAGQVPVKLSLLADQLPGDDVRYFCMSVRPTLNVMLIDGEVSTRPFESETDFLTLAYTIGEPWNVTRATEGEWNAGKNATSDLIVLANVATLTGTQVKELERYVSAGGGLMIFAGELIDIASYNERLYVEGKGLLPAKLEGAVDGPVSGVVVEDVQSSPLELLKKLDPASLARVKINRYMSVENVKNTDEVRVLARWNNSQASPAIIEKRFGRGRVLLFTVTADKAWSDWPLEPSFVLASRASATNIARGRAQQENIVAGQPIQWSLPETETAIEPRVRLTTGELTPMQFIPATDQAPPILKYDQTARAGAYTLLWKDAAGNDQQRLVCVSPSLAESNLEPISESELSDLLKPLDATIVRYAGVSSLSDKGREIWRTLAVALLALAGVETLFAVWVGRER